MVTVLERAQPCAEERQLTRKTRTTKKGERVSSSDTAESAPCTRVKQWLIHPTEDQDPPGICTKWFAKTVSNKSFHRPL